MATDEPEKATEGVEDHRLSALNAQLAKVQHAEKVRTAGHEGNLGMAGKGANQGNRVLSVLIGFPLGGALIGWLIDRAMVSAPWGMLVLLFLGIVAAGREIWRISKEKPE